MKIRPSRWLPALELIWGGLVMCMAAAPNAKTIYAIRFLVGLCEASAYPGMMTLLGNWYTPQELGKRSVIFQQSSAAAQMFSGYVSSRACSVATSSDSYKIIASSKPESTTA
jgi:ACS family pantothenate transporter-like MFS transporter